MKEKKIMLQIHLVFHLSSSSSAWFHALLMEMAPQYTRRHYSSNPKIF
jgi:hypothetical protein